MERIRRDAANARDRLITNLVIMGMGEPMANYDNLLAALDILNADWGTGIGARKITISTSGLSRAFVNWRSNLSSIGWPSACTAPPMRCGNKYAYQPALPAQGTHRGCREYQSVKNGMITLEYILIEGINDHLDQVVPLAQLAKQLRAKVNLIPYNQVDGRNEPTQRGRRTLSWMA